LSEANDRCFRRTDAIWATKDWRTSWRFDRFEAEGIARSGASGADIEYEAAQPAMRRVGVAPRMPQHTDRDLRRREGQGEACIMTAAPEAVAAGMRITFAVAAVVIFVALALAASGLAPGSRR
jgi:hypothetical protein